MSLVVTHDIVKFVQHIAALQIPSIDQRQQFYPLWADSRLSIMGIGFVKFIGLKFYFSHSHDI
jgi:hypothetical protein